MSQNNHDEPMAVESPLIPVYQPSFSGNERDYLLDCIQSGWISSQGHYVDRFESAFRAFTNANYATTVANGTVAIHLALVALGIGPGDEVLVPTLTYVAPVNAILMVGATPVFVDSLDKTWQLDVDDAERKISARTKCILVVHLYGHPAAMDSVMHLADRYNLRVVEDAAEAFGSYFDNKHVGTFGDVGTFSFFGNKTITTGEGGMVTSRDSDLAAELRLLKSQYMSPTKRYWHDKLGYNYRLTNLQAAVGLAQLERAGDILAKKARLASRYQRLLKDVDVGVHQSAYDVKHSYWMVSVTLPANINRDSVIDFLSCRGVETRPVFYPVHRMPMYAGWPSSCHRFPVADRISSRSLNLPSWPDLTDGQIQYVVECLAQAIKACRLDYC
jgi:perosamine synthetase